MKFYSHFRLALALFIIGILWTWFAFSDGIKGSETSSVNSGDSAQFKFLLKGNGLGFYQISIQDYQSHDFVDVWVFGPLGNIISAKKIDTMMVVNYFEFDTDGNYNIQVKNPSNRTMKFAIEYGDTHSSQLLIPGIIVGAGSILLVYVTFRKMMNYRISQPE